MRTGHGRAATSSIPIKTAAPVSRHGCAVIFICFLADPSLLCLFYFIVALFSSGRLTLDVLLLFGSALYDLLFYCRSFLLFDDCRLLLSLLALAIPLFYVCFSISFGRCDCYRDYRDDVCSVCVVCYGDVVANLRCSVDCCFADVKCCVSALDSHADGVAVYICYHTLDCLAG